jgi:methylated-DNA-protein-cysteine methyltransferase related protein
VAGSVARPGFPGHILNAVVSAAAHADRGELILERIRRVPEGFVRTYGDVSPGAPRLAGAVLSACGDPSVPWHRIVRADGSLTQGRRQRRLLEREGVPFRGERVEMRVAHLPREAL